MATRYYRVVRSRPPTLDDFTSNQAKGIPMARPDPEVSLLWDGISVYATENQAGKRATALPRLGAYVAELTIFEGDPITIRRSGNSQGHHTLWGAPADLLARVTKVVDV
jgi:hypothetical protein